MSSAYLWIQFLDLTVFSGKTHTKHTPSNFLHHGDYVHYGLKEIIRHHLS